MVTYTRTSWLCVRPVHAPSPAAAALQVDTLFMLAATIYITQLLFFTWALADQQAEKWPLLGYIMVPVLMLQHGDTAWYVHVLLGLLCVYA